MQYAWARSRKALMRRQPRGVLAQLAPAAPSLDANQGTITVNSGSKLENRNNGGTLNNNLILNTGSTYSYTGTGQTNIGSAANSGSTLFLAGDATINNVVANTAGKIFINGGQLSSNTTVTISEQEEIVRRHLPFPVSRPKKQIARWRYRLCNLPRYLARARLRGFQTSYQLLQSTAPR